MGQPSRGLLSFKSKGFHWRRWIDSLSLLLLSSLLTILFLEFVVFRYILVAPPVVRTAFINGVLKHEPNQRVKGGYGKQGLKTYNFNNQGWKSAHQNYTLEKPPGKFRIAIIGDSFVNAGRVDFDQSLAEQLERRLGSDAYEVYRFGMSGVPLSQYLHMFRKEVMQYTPDMTIFVLVHNDFRESYNITLGRYGEALMRLKIVDGRVVGEIEPKAYKQPWFIWIMRSATYRYLVQKRGLNIQLIKDFFNWYRLKEVYQANIDISNIEERAKLDYATTDYLFAKIKEEAAKIGTRLLIVMDGDRESIYEGLPSKELYNTGALRLNRMANQLAKKYNISFVDLHPVFKQNYKLKKKWFNPRDNYHWNEHGHAVVAETIALHPLLTP